MSGSFVYLQQGTIMLRINITCAIITSLLFPALASAAQPTTATGYAIYGAGNVELTSYSTSIGPIYAGGNLALDFGYGIQRSSQNSGDMYARGNLTLGNLSDVNGSLYANHSVTLGNDESVTGNIRYGTGYTNGSSFNTIGGTATQQFDTVAPVGLPKATSFTPGFTDAIHNTSFSLAPGSYGAVTESGLFQSVHLTSGTYYLNSLSLLDSTSLYLDFNGTQPIKVYVQGDINIDSGFNVYVNGVAVGNGNNGLQTGYAGLTLFETHGNFTMGSGFLNYFYGTIFAPQGSVTMNVQDMFGSIIAGGDIKGNVYMDERSSQLVTAPEPATIALVAIAAPGLALLALRRRKNAAA
jgi:hypothetical protein